MIIDQWQQLNNEVIRLYLQLTFMKGRSQMGRKLVLNRLTNELRDWQKDHPFGFTARPILNTDGSTDLLKWQCWIPGPKDSAWQGATYKLIMHFNKDYPASPPRCIFQPKIPHPNIQYAPPAKIWLSLINQEQDWKPYISVKKVLLGIQKMLKDEPNMDFPAQPWLMALYQKNKEIYIEMVQNFVKSYKQM